MKDYEFNKKLAWAMTLKHNNYHDAASELLDKLADALLYQQSYKKQSLDEALFCALSLRARKGKEVASFLVAKVREDREQEMTCSLTDELAVCLPARRQEEEEKETSAIVALVEVIRSNKKLFKALVKNASAQYVNRVLANDSSLNHLHGKGQKLKNFFKSNLNLFF